MPDIPYIPCENRRPAGMPLLKDVTVNGTLFRVPLDELTDPNPRAGGHCPWFDTETDAVCTIPGPHGIAHIAHDGEGNIVAIWDEAHGYLGTEDVQLTIRVPLELSGDASAIAAITQVAQQYVTANYDERGRPRGEDRQHHHDR